MSKSRSKSNKSFDNEFIDKERDLIAEAEKQLKESWAQYAGYMQSFSEFMKENALFKNAIEDRLNRLAKEWEQLDIYIKEYHESLDERLRGLKLKQIALKLNDLNSNELDTIYDYLTYFKMYIDHKVLDQHGIEQTSKMINQLVELQLNSLPMNLTDYFQVNDSVVKIAKLYSEISNKFYKKYGIKLEAYYNARTIRFINCLTTVYPGILMAKAERGLDVIIVATNKDKNMLDSNSNIIKQDELDTKLLQNDVKLQCKYGELKTLQDSSNETIQNIWKSLIMFQLRNRSNKEFIDFIGFYNENSNNIDESVCIVSHDENTLKKFNKLLSLYFKMYETNVIFHSRYLMDTWNSVTLEEDEEESFYSQNDDYFKVSFVNAENKNKSTNLLKSKTIYLHLWELYCNTKWIVKNIRNQWSSKIDNWLNMNDSSVFITDEFLFMRNKIKQYNKFIEDNDKMFIDKLRKVVQKKNLEYWLQLKSFDNMIKLYPQNKLYYEDGKKQYIQQYGGLLKEYIQTVCDDDKFVDIRNELLSLIVKSETENSEDIQNISILK